MQHTGTFAGQQQQRLAQDAARRLNSIGDVITALTNRGYAALATDVVATTSYVTLLSSAITTVLSSGYLVITFSASCVHTTNAATIYFQLLVDNVVKKGAYTTFFAAATGACVAMVLRVPVTKGPHVVALQWKSDNVTGRINAATVNEEHAHMLIEEAT